MPQNYWNTVVLRHPFRCSILPFTKNPHFHQIFIIIACYSYLIRKSNRGYSKKRQRKNTVKRKGQSFMYFYDENNNASENNEISRIGKEKKKNWKKPLGFLSTAATFGFIAGLGLLTYAYEGNTAIPKETSSITTNYEDFEEETDLFSDAADGQSAQVQQVSTVLPTDLNLVNANVIDVSDIVDASLPSVVAVNCITYKESNISSMFGNRSQFGGSSGGGTIVQESSSCGTGIIIGESNTSILILTNNHVIDGADKVSVVFVDDTEVSGSVLGADSDADIAVIEILLSDIADSTKSAIKTAVFGDSEAVKVGEAAIAIGNALGYGQSVTTGVISAVNREVDLVDKTMTLIQTDAAINGGNSGGPLLNSKGETIGINTIKYSSTGVEGMGYAIPINLARPIIENIIDNAGNETETPAGAYLGLYGIDVTPQMYGLPEGVFVYETVSGSPAAQYGITAGSVITGIDGETVKGMEDLAAILAKRTGGETVNITMMVRNGNQYMESTVSVVLGSAEE